MKLKDLSVGLDVAIINTRSIESHSRAFGYTIVDLRAWVMRSWSHQKPSEKPDGLPEDLLRGADWHGGIFEVDSFKPEFGRQPGVLAVTHTVPHRLTVLPLREIRGPLAEVQAEIDAAKGIATRVREDQRRADANRMARFQRALVRGKHALGKKHEAGIRGNEVTLTLDEYERIVDAIEEA